MSKKKIFALLAFIFSIILSVVFFVFQDFFIEAKSLGLLGIFIANAASAAAVFISAPAFITVFQGGGLYNPFLVGIVAAAGTAVGEIVSYIFGFSGRKLANHKLSKKIWFRVVEEIFEKHGTLVLFVLAIFPNPLFDVVGIMAGVFKYPLLKFFVVVFIGRAIRYILLAFVGSKF